MQVMKYFLKPKLICETEIRYGVLHNRKTGGTALRDVIQQQERRTPERLIRSFGHSMSLPRFLKQFPTAKAIFFVRDPVSRFVSGFYSRFRQGKPRYNSPWSKGETKAFKHFHTPNELAEALSSANLLKRWHAIAAMKSIGHVRHTYKGFLGTLAFLKKNTDKIVFIGHQKELNQDFLHLQTLLKLDPDLVIPEDDTRAHRNPADVDRYLSEIAVENLKKWYQADYEIYAWCLDKRKVLLGNNNERAC